MHSSMHVTDTYRWLKKGGPWGVSIFEGGAGFPCQGVGSTLLPPANLPAAVRLNDLRIVPPASTKCNFPSFSRETWSLAVSALKIDEI
jgi:hypothetical protein